MASGSKSFTALAVMSLVEDGALSLDTTARSLLGDDLPLIDDAVTVEQLLAHRSGIGDYIDEDLDLPPDGYVMDAPVHRLDVTTGFLRSLDGFPTKFAPGERFSYCNGGYVVLALLIERASGRPFHELVTERVIERAGLTRTAYLRTDELPGDVALGYLAPTGLRTNVLHLPVRGNGDGGAFTSATDVSTFWEAFLGGRIVSAESVALMTTPHSIAEPDRFAYGFGFWLPLGRDAIQMEGADAGVAFRSVHDRDRSVTSTVMSNVTDGGVGDLPAHRRTAERTRRPLRRDDPLARATRSASEPLRHTIEAAGPRIEAPRLSSASTRALCARPPPPTQRPPRATSARPARPSDDARSGRPLRRRAPSGRPPARQRARHRPAAHPSSARPSARRPPVQRRARPTHRSSAPLCATDLRCA